MRNGNILIELIYLVMLMFKSLQKLLYSNYRSFQLYLINLCSISISFNDIDNKK